MIFEEAQRKLDKIHDAIGAEGIKQLNLLVAPIDKSEREDFIYRVDTYINGKELALRAVRKRDFDVYGYSYKSDTGLSIIYNFAEPENILLAR